LRLTGGLQDWAALNEDWPVPPRRSIQVIIALAVALAALVLAALILIRPVLLVPVIVGVAAGAAVGAVVTLRRRAERQRREISRRPPQSTGPGSESGSRRPEVTVTSRERLKSRRPKRGPGVRTLAAVALLGIAVIAVAVVILGGGQEYAAPPNSSTPTPTPTPPAGSQPVTIGARYRGTAVLSADDWQITESLWLKGPDYLSRRYRRAVREALRPSAAVSGALKAHGWTVDGRDRWGLKVTLKHTATAEVRGPPHLLTANTLPVAAIRLSSANLARKVPFTLRVVAEKGSRLTVTTLRRGVYNADPPASSHDVPGGRTDTEFTFPDDGLRSVSVDIGNRVARTTLFSALHAAAVWNGIWGLLVVVFTGLVGVWVKNRWEKPSPAARPAAASGG
jgi:hypothetical protein